MQSTAQRSITSGVSFVHPVRAVQSGLIPCSAVENLCTRVHQSFAEFFEVRDNADVEQIYDHMKQGLSRVLYQMPILAGTLRQNERGDFSVEIPESPRAGVYFHFSDVSRDGRFPSFKELGKRGFPLIDASRDGLKELRPDPFPKTEDGHPTFVAKITYLRGGICWVASLSHLITDIAQGRALALAWARFTNESFQKARMGLKQPIPKQIPMPDRKRLIPSSGCILNSAEIAEINKSGALQTHVILDPSRPEEMMRDIDAIMLKATIGHTTKLIEKSKLMEPISGVWRFSPAQLDILKAKVRQNADGAQLSQFDIIAAFIWQRFHLAKRGSPSANLSEHRNAQIVTVMDVRRKLNPPLPADYLGICIDLVRCSLDEKTLLVHESQEQKWKGLADVAKSIRQSDDAWKEDGYMNLLSLSLRTPISPGVVPKGPIDMLITDHALFADVVAADWGGELGKCVALREPYIERETPRGEVIIYPNQPNGDLDVMISAEAIVLKRLMADPEMMAMCDNLFVRHNVVDAYNSIQWLKTKL